MEDNVIGISVMKRLKRIENGITFPEILIASLILSLVGVVFMTALASNYRVLRNTDQRTTAESLARSQMEAINNAPYDGTAPYSYDNYTITGIPSGYRITIAAVPIDPVTGDNSTMDLGIQKVTVTVICQNRLPDLSSTVLVLESYKR
jgi:Tfp pilus assembly protein PilV